MTIFGLIFGPLTALCILRGARSWVPWLLAASMPFMTSSAIVIGSSKVTPFHIVAFSALFFVVFRPSGHRAALLGQLSIVVGVYMTLTALLLPRIFAGQPVLIPREGIDGQVDAPGELAFSLSNVAQAGYVILGLAVVVFFATNRTPRHILTTSFGVGTVLNLWALGAQLSSPSLFPKALFASGVGGEKFSSSYNGNARLSGIFSEPSVLGTFAIAAAVYSLFLLWDAPRKRWPLAMLVANGLLLFFSFSGTGLVSAIIIIGIVVAVIVLRFFSGQIKVPGRVGAMLLLVTAGVVFALAQVIDFFHQFIFDKLNSQSYANRDGSNIFSVEIFKDTYGLGAGLGSSRPSSFFYMLISNVGVVGLVLFALLILLVMRRASDGRHRPELWCLVAVLVAKVVGEPNMSLPLMWLAIGACAAAFYDRGDADIVLSGQDSRLVVNSP